MFHKLLSLTLPLCFILWVCSFLSDHRATVQVAGSRSHSFRIRRGVPQGSALGPVLFILFVDDITKDLPRGAHVSLYADLAIWSSSPDPLKASSVVQFSPTVQETWSNLWRLPLNPKKYESSLFSTDPHQATFQPLLNLLGIPLSFNPTPKFLGVTFDRTLILWGPRPIPVFEILSTPQSPSLHSHCLLGSNERISLPTLQSLCATGAQVCLSWTVPIPLQHRNQSLGSPTQSCMQGHYWVPLFHPLLPTPSWGPTPSSKANSRTSGRFLLRTCSVSTPRLLQLQCPGN